jgi:hypothetical protein
MLSGAAIVHGCQASYLKLCRINMSVSLEKIGFDKVSERSLFLLSAERPVDLADIQIMTGSRYFVAFIAWDSCNASASEMASLARMLLDAGCVYFCCWGPGCERIHDVIDEEYARDGLSVESDDSTIMTTWHNNESLEEAIWFPLDVAFPDDRFFEECRSVVAVCIGSRSWATQITTALKNPRALVARVVQ